MKKRKTHRALSFLMTALMITGLFGNSAIKVLAADPVNLVTNGGFEENGMGNCIQNGSAVLQVTTEAAATGTHSLKVTNTQNNWDGPAYDFKSLVQAGHTYNVSFKAKAVSGQLQAGTVTSETLNVQLHKDPLPAGETNAYPALAWAQAINETAWTPITTQFTATGTTAYTTLLMYIATADKGLQFYIDDVVVTDTTPTTQTSLVVNSGFEDTSLNGGLGNFIKSGNPTLTVTTEAAASGTHSLKVSNTPNNWDAPAYEFKNIMQLGHTYGVSLKAKAVAGQLQSGAVTAETLNVQFHKDPLPAEETNAYPTIAYQTAINETSWTTISGSFQATGTTAYTTLQLVIGTSNANLQFFIDDVIVTDTTPATPPPPVTSTIGIHAPVAGTNLITESTFEDGLTTSWAGRAGTEQLSVIADPANASNHALQVTGRTTSWHGPSYELIEKVKAGSYYNVSLKVKAAPGQTGAKTVDVSYQTTVNGSQTWPGISGAVAISDTQWTTITGEMSLADATNSMTQLSIYVQSSNTTLSYLIDDVSVVEDASKLPQPVQTNIPSLKDVYKEYFILGGEVEPAQIQAGTSNEQLVSKHYGILVPGNEMKPSSLEATKGTWTWGPAEQVVDYAKAHDLPMRGHTLVWHSQVPDWLFQDPSDATKTATHDQLIANETEYIRGVLTHLIQKYGTADGNTANGLNPTGKISPLKYFDTVNEVIDDNTTLVPGGYRNSKWHQISGLDYIRTAFKVAHEIDPSLELYINDYNTENNGAKTQAEYDLVKKLLDEKIPVGGVGMQMHMNVNTDINAVKASIEKFASLGLPIQITELDLRTNENPVTQNGLAKQALVYKQLFDMLKTEKDKVTAVLFWGTTDADSWLKPDLPLLFSAQYQAKPAYWAIVDPSQAAVVRQSVQAVNGTPADVNDLDWNTVKPIAANTFAKGSSGATATVRTMWDSKNLYVKATVVDATVGENDSIDLYVDKADSKAASYEPNANYMHITVKRSESVSDANGYTAYVIIPIDDITPAVNKVLGFDARVNDAVGNEAVVSQAVLNDYGNRQDTNAAYFADLKLGAPSKIAKAIYGTPAVDGTVESLWSSADEVSTDTFVLGTSGATAKVKTMWDEHNLYVLAQVTDSALNKASANVWEQDSVEIFVDQNNGKTSSYQSDDSQIRVNFDNLLSSGGNMPEGFVSDTSKTAIGYIVEMAIPFNKVTPAAGKVLGFDAQVNNADASGARVSAATWNDASSNGYQNTSGFGNLLLVDTTGPVITVSGNKDVYTVDESLEFKFSAVDTVSGLESISQEAYKVDAYTLNIGKNIVTVDAVDKLGNRSVLTVEFEVKVTYDSLIKLTNRSVNTDNLSLSTKLQQVKDADTRGNLKLKESMIKTYISEVNAQKGKMIDATKANLLVKLAEML
jgi:endo-1,4-beta-xylanase